MTDALPEADLTHIILTRFNTAIDYAPSARGIDDQWLRERLLLFEQYCLPSVMAQRSASFLWLAFCDDRSPAWFRLKMEEYHPALTTIYVNGPATDNRIAQIVRQTGLVASRYLITTRLDNDDSIGDQHLALVQREFSYQERQFILFPFGLQLLRGHLYNVYWPANPFLSLVEQVKPDGSFTTVFCVPHDKVRSTGLVKDIHVAPQWLQVLHGGNLLNALRGWPRIGKGYPAQFPIRWSKRESESLFDRLRLAAGAVAIRIRRLIKKLRSSSP